DCRQDVLVNQIQAVKTLAQLIGQVRETSQKLNLVHILAATQGGKVFVQYLGNAWVVRAGQGIRRAHVRSSSSGRSCFKARAQSMRAADGVRFRRCATSGQSNSSRLCSTMPSR